VIGFTLDNRRLNRFLLLVEICYASAIIPSILGSFDGRRNAATDAENAGRLARPGQTKQHCGGPARSRTLVRIPANRKARPPESRALTERVRMPQDRVRSARSRSQTTPRKARRRECLPSRQKSEFADALLAVRGDAGGERGVRGCSLKFYTEEGSLGSAGKNTAVLAAGDRSNFRTASTRERRTQLQCGKLLCRDRAVAVLAIEQHAEHQLIARQDAASAHLLVRRGAPLSSRNAPRSSDAEPAEGCFERRPSRRFEALRIAQGQRPFYEANSFNGSVEDKSAKEPPLRISGENRYYHRLV
jgi:hypothetical protein